MDIDFDMLETVFCYVVKTNEQKQYVDIDFSLCMYNQVYKSFEFYEEKFPKGYEKISKARKGWKPTDEMKKKMSEGKKGHKMYTDEWRTKISNSLKGKHKSEEFKKHQSEITKGNTNRRKMVLQYDKQGDFIKEWESAFKAALSLNKKTGAAITEVCNGKGKRKSIYGYIWKYKN